MTTGATATERLHLDRVAADAWPAIERAEHDGWLLRAARTPDGAPVTRRANSGLPLTPLTDGHLDAVTAFYRARGGRPLLQVSDPDLADALAALGWHGVSPTLVMTGALPDGDAALVEPTPSESWLTAWWSVDGGTPAGLDVARQCLAGIGSPTGYAAVVRENGQVVAVGRGVVQQGWLGVFAMGVLPDHRRRGLGRQVLGALGAWGAALGASRAYLQVEVGNTAARSLYAHAGLEPAYDYRYWSPV